MATHAFGAQLTYTSINANTYIINYTLYRDCSGIFPSSTVQINITNTCGYPNQSFSIPQISSPVDLNPMCPQDVPTTCQGGIHTGVQKYVYSDTIVLNGPCNWTVSHAESSRSSSLTTITGAGSDDLFVYCLINNTTGANNSPVFLNEPALYVCLGTQFVIDQGISDSDGDSLSMQLITPLVASGSLVTYYFGYSQTQPLISVPPMSFNSTTGMLAGYPSQPDISVYAILVNEYRNGILIGQVERDLSLIAKICSNTIPDISGFDGTNNYTITVAPGIQSCFTLAGLDPDNGQSTDISLAGSMAGLSFSHTGNSQDTATVCWTPSASDSINNPNCFSLQISDDACPFVGTQTRTYCINVSLVDGIENNSLPIVDVYPNPFNENLQLTTDHFSEFEINVYDLSGRAIFRKLSTGKTHILNFPAIENGVYLLSIQDVRNDAGKLWKRVVRQSRK